MRKGISCCDLTFLPSYKGESLHSLYISITASYLYYNPSRSGTLNQKDSKTGWFDIWTQPFCFLCLVLYFLAWVLLAFLQLVGFRQAGSWSRWAAFSDTFARLRANTASYFALCLPVVEYKVRKANEGLEIDREMLIRFFKTCWSQHATKKQKREALKH